jgi:cytochrome c1
MKRLILSGLAALALAAPAFAAGETPIPPSQRWSWSGPLGLYDRAELQRGFQVYSQVCASCHSMNLLAYRNLAERGGPEFSRSQAIAIAAQVQVPQLNDRGETVERPAELKDRFRNPFANQQAAAAANNGKIPPDLSLMTKARTYPRGFPWWMGDAVTGFNFDQGANYVYGLLVGYQDPPAGEQAQEGLYYNRYFPGHWIGMAPPLQDGAVQYSDGSPQTVAQYARDVTAFMMWAAEPRLEERKRMGFVVMIFLVLFAGLLYYTKKKVWRAAH